MKLTNLRTNNMDNPLGFHYESLRFSWVTERETDDTAIKQTAARIEVALDDQFEDISYDSGKSSELDSLGHLVDLGLTPRNRYFWRVTVWADTGEEIKSDVAWFETAKEKESWQAKWISPLFEDKHPYLRKTFELKDKAIKTARLYMTGLGIYTFEINAEKDSSEYLTPGFHSYDFWLQYQTYDVKNKLKNGSNTLGIMLGDGWYKGRFGFDGGHYNLYGDKLSTIAELVVTYDDGEEEVIKTDESWSCHPSPVTFSGIYDGEYYDATKEIIDWSQPTLDDAQWENVKVIDGEKDKLQARLSLPIKRMEKLSVKEVIKTRLGETVLDFGQNITGWVEFTVDEPKNQEITLKHGEVMQEGVFYQENLRTAEAKYRYISGGEKRTIEPKFTFFGFRYVKVEGLTQNLNPDDFTAYALYSDIDTTGDIETSNKKVNQLFQNALWSQKDNFLDVPTDCPQRDERMGWTGDAQIFASTASFNMYSPAFFRKFLKDLREEQKALDGSVPYIVPTIKPPNDPGFVTGHGSAAWGDAATIIPWTLFQHYGDKEELRLNFPIMKDWVDYIKRTDDENGSDRLWLEGFHFGDWLALDGTDPSGTLGGTDEHYIASAYYAYSAQLVAKAASVLDEQELSQDYQQLAKEIKEAIYAEYFTKNGRAGIPTQTTYIVALYMDLIPEDKKMRAIKELRDLLFDKDVHLSTGFVGTPYLPHVLSENGHDELAYTLLLNEDYPSWLFSVNTGATTIWERWNSINEDGLISGTGMNSLNHYAYGSIIDWVYKKVIGINPDEKNPGYSKFILAPKPDYRLGYAKASFDSPKGLIRSEWEIINNGKSLSYEFEIPFDTEAKVTLLLAEASKVVFDGQPLEESEFDYSETNGSVTFILNTGIYEVEYETNQPLKPTFSSKMSLVDLVARKESRDILYEVFPETTSPLVRNNNSHQPLRTLKDKPIVKRAITEEKVKELDEKLAQL